MTRLQKFSQYDKSLYVIIYFLPQGYGDQIAIPLWKKHIQPHLGKPDKGYNWDRCLDDYDDLIIFLVLNSANQYLSFETQHARIHENQSFRSRF